MGSVTGSVEVGLNDFFRSAVPEVARLWQERIDLSKIHILIRKIEKIEKKEKKAIDKGKLKDLLAKEKVEAKDLLKAILALSHLTNNIYADIASLEKTLLKSIEIDKLVEQVGGAKEVVQHFQDDNRKERQELQKTLKRMADMSRALSAKLD